MKIKFQNWVETQAQCPVFPLKINFWQEQSNLTQTYVSNFSGIVQFGLIFMYFVTDYLQNQLFAHNSS